MRAARKRARDLTSTLARLNHVFIPDTKEGRDRLRRTAVGRLMQPAVGLYYALTDEGRFLSIFWLVTGAAGIEVGTTQIYALWALLTGLLVGSLVVRRRHALTGARLTIEAPARVTVGEITDLVVKVHNHGETDVTGLRIQGPLLPWDGRYVGPREAIPHVPPGGTATAVVRARFSARGEHHLDAFYVGRVIPPGLAVGPGLISEGTRLMVVPPVAAVSRVILPTRARYQESGSRSGAAGHAATEFVGVRPYRPGDPVRDLHARTSARLGIPVVREYRQEYLSHVAVVLDTSDEWFEAQFEAAVSVAAGAVARLVYQGGLVDLVAGALHPLPRGAGGAEAALDLLACVTRGGELSVPALDALLAPRLQSLSAVLLVAPVLDRPRHAFVQALTRRGVPARVVVVSDDEPLTDHPQMVRVLPDAALGGVTLSL